MIQTWRMVVFPSPSPPSPMSPSSGTVVNSRRRAPHPIWLAHTLCQSASMCQWSRTLVDGRKKLSVGVLASLYENCCIELLGLFVCLLLGDQGDPGSPGVVHHNVKSLLWQICQSSLTSPSRPSRCFSSQPRSPASNQFSLESNFEKWKSQKADLNRKFHAKVKKHF